MRAVAPEQQLRAPSLKLEGTGCRPQDGRNRSCDATGRRAAAGLRSRPLLSGLGGSDKLGSYEDPQSLRGRLSDEPADQPPLDGSSSMSKRDGRSLFETRYFTQRSLVASFAEATKRCFPLAPAGAIWTKTLLGTSQMGPKSSVAGFATTKSM